MQNVGPGKRIAYTAVDIAIYSAVTFTLAAVLGWSPVFDFMGAYDAEQQHQYWGMFWLAVVIVSAGSLWSHASKGQSLGKWLFGAKSVRLDGSPSVPAARCGGSSTSGQRCC